MSGGWRLTGGRGSLRLYGSGAWRLTVEEGALDCTGGGWGLMGRGSLKKRWEFCV